MRPQKELHDAVIEVQTGMASAGYYKGSIDGWWGGGSRSSFNAMMDAARRYSSGTTPADIPYGNQNASASQIFTDEIYRQAAARIKSAALSIRPIEEIIAAVKAFKEVESGSGWFTDVARVIALDGPGGWLDGTSLPKILFEAHKFGKHTNYKFNTSHPNLSSKAWNKRLYIGGAGEWERLWKAMALDKDAALKSASVGTFQILGENFKDAGFKDVQSFWDAHMQGGAAAHMDAFVSFIINGKHATALAAITGNPADCRGIAHRYNGAAYAKNDYHTKIAKAYLKYLKG